MSGSISSSPSASLEVGGFTPLSTTDWPGMLAAVVFVQGCPWRCHYCHNAALQPRGGGDASAWPRIVSRLSRRPGLLDGVVFSGGEPTLDSALPAAIAEVRALGLKAGLHTAGLYPERLQALLPQLDWVGFDVKTALPQYDRVTGVPRSGEPVHDSLRAVLDSGIDVECRTTWHPALISDQALLELADTLRAWGARRWVLQRYRPAPGTPQRLADSWHEPPAGLVQQLHERGPALTLR